MDVTIGTRSGVEAKDFAKDWTNYGTSIQDRNPTTVKWEDDHRYERQGRHRTSNGSRMKEVDSMSEEIRNKIANMERTYKATRAKLLKMAKKLVNDRYAKSDIKETVRSRWHELKQKGLETNTPNTGVVFTKLPALTENKTGEAKREREAPITVRLAEEIATPVPDGGGQQPVAQFKRTTVEGNSQQIGRQPEESMRRLCQDEHEVRGYSEWKGDCQFGVIIMADTPISSSARRPPDYDAAKDAVQEKLTTPRLKNIGNYERVLDVPIASLIGWKSEDRSTQREGEQYRGQFGVNIKEDLPQIVAAVILSGTGQRPKTRCLRTRSAGTTTSRTRDLISGNRVTCLRSRPRIAGTYFIRILLCVCSGTMDRSPRVIRTEYSIQIIEEDDEVTELERSIQMPTPPLTMHEPLLTFAADTPACRAVYGYRTESSNSTTIKKRAGYTLQLLNENPNKPGYDRSGGGSVSLLEKDRLATKTDDALLNRAAHRQTPVSTETQLSKKRALTSSPVTSVRQDPRATKTKARDKTSTNQTDGQPSKKQSDNKSNGKSSKRESDARTTKRGNDQVPRTSGVQPMTSGEVALSPISTAEAGPDTDQILQEVNGRLEELVPRLDPTCPNLDTLPVQISGILHLSLRFCHNQGHVEVDRRDLEEVRSWDPALQGEIDVLPIFFAVLQTLGSTPDAKEILYGWASAKVREGNNGAGSDIVQGPRLKPWARRDLWSFGLWALTTEIITRFLDHGLNCVEAEFMKGLGDLRQVANQDAWAIQIIVFALYQLRASPWFWPTLFRNDRTQFPG